MLIREIHLRGEDAFQRTLRPTERAGGHNLVLPATPPKHNLLIFDQLVKRSVAGEFHEARTLDICSLSLYTTKIKDNDKFDGVISSLCPIKNGDNDESKDN